MNIPSIIHDLKKAEMESGPLKLEVRKQRLLKLKEIIRESEACIFKALQNDPGKPEYETYLTESGFILEEISYILKNIGKWVKPKKVRTPFNLMPAKSFIHAEPYGVVLVISPWNYPFQLCFSPLIGALAAGNRIVVKPSEYTSSTSKVIKEIIEKVFREDEVRVVEGGIEETKILLKQKFDYIFFTGSTSVGKEIMKAAAENLTPVTLELGGKSPLLIDETANLNLTAKRVTWGKFMNAGQTCVAPDYVLIPKNRQNEFLDCMEKHLKDFYGEDISKSRDFARIVSDGHFERLRGLVLPEKLALGGIFSREERFISPTIMKDVSWEDKIMQEEIFGPILPVLPYENLNEVVAELKKRPKPLAFYLFSENPKFRQDLIARISFGGGCVNDTVMHLANPHLPFGGVGESGIGHYHGKKSFETFTHYKSVLFQSTKVDIPVRYPPYRKKLNWLKLFLR